MKVLTAAIAVFVFIPGTSFDVAGSTGLEGLGDPKLDSLIEVALRQNYDVAAAAKRISVARNNMLSARGAYFPQIGLSAGWSRDRVPGAVTPGASSSYESSFSGMANMSWEIDVFGKITRQVREKKDQIKVTSAEYGGVMVSVASELASAYVQLRLAEAQRELARQHAARQAQVVHITEVRHETGLASMLDVSQAKTVYYSTTASIPLLEYNIRSAQNSIKVLTGEEIGNIGLLSAPDTAVDSTLMPGHDLSLGALTYKVLMPRELPMQLVDKRPDVVAAKRSVAVAADALGIAKSDYLPTLTLTGSIGTRAHNAGDLFTGNSFVYSIAPTLSWTLFDGLSRRYNAVAARADMEAQIDNYNMTMLTAVEEVDNAFVKYNTILRNIDALEDVVKWSTEEERLSLDLYKQGLTAFSNVVDAQLNLLESQNSLLTAQGNALIALIDLYKALGGGWKE